MSSTTIDPLDEFCQDVEANGELIRCSSCFNTLTMAGTYEIQEIPGKKIGFLPHAKVEGLLCERCVELGRKPTKAVLIVGEKGSDKQRVTYVNIDDLETVKPSTEDPPAATEDETRTDTPS